MGQTSRTLPWDDAGPGSRPTQNHKVLAAGQAQLKGALSSSELHAWQQRNQKDHHATTQLCNVLGACYADEAQLSPHPICWHVQRCKGASKVSMGLIRCSSTNQENSIFRAKAPHQFVAQLLAVSRMSAKHTTHVFKPTTSSTRSGTLALPFHGSYTNIIATTWRPSIQNGRHTTLTIIQVSDMRLQATSNQLQMKVLICCCAHGLFAPIFGPDLPPQQPAESRLQQLPHTPRSRRMVLAGNPQKRTGSNSTSPNPLNRRRCLAPPAVGWKQPCDANNHDMKQEAPQYFWLTAKTERVTSTDKQPFDKPISTSVGIK